MAAIPDVHLFGKLDNIVSELPAESTVELGSVEIALCGYGSQAPRVPGEAMLARVTQGIGANPSPQDDGTFEVWLYNNTVIVPDGTFYTVTIKNTNGDITQVNAYRFTTAGDFDLDSLIPYDPNQPPPPLPPLITNWLLIIGDSQYMQFPGDEFTAFKTTLTGDVWNPQIANMVPGNLYTFIIEQGPAGGHAFAWPVDVHNATPVTPVANGTTVQTFIADENGELWAIGPGTWI